MIWAVFRAGSKTFDPDKFLASRPELQPVAAWRVGERFGNRIHDVSGFSISLPSLDTFDALLAEAKVVIDGLDDVLQELRRLDAEMEVDFGLPVGGEKVFAQRIRLDPEDLTWFAKRGLSVWISAYPCGPDDPDDPKP